MNPGLAIFKRAQHLQGGDQTVTDQQMIDRLGYDPGDPRNDLTRGFGSGVPTQRGIGMAANIGGNLIFPGLGTAVLGPGASWFTRWLQGFLGRQGVQNALNPSQPGQPTSGTPDDTGDGTDNTPPTSSGSGDSPTGNAPPTTGVGIDPTGNPAKPGEWWSNDFGRWLTDQYGTSPGNYQGAGPGLGYGHLGTGFGSGTVGNFATALGFESLGTGGSPSHLGAAWGGIAGPQLRQISKGIYSPMTGYGYGPLSGFTGTAPPSGATNIAAQQQLHDIMMANPGAMSGVVSPNITHGVPQHLSVQKGSSNIMQTTGNNPGLRLFMQTQKLKRPKPQGYAKGSSGIHIKPSHKGLFTAKAKGAGMGVQQYASKVLSPNSSASASTRRQANFAKNAAKWNK